MKSLVPTTTAPSKHVLPINKLPSSCLPLCLYISSPNILFTDIKLYVQKSIRHDEVKALISATLSIPNCDIQEEILQLILNLLTSGDHSHQLGQSIMSMGTPLLTLLHSKSNLVRQAVTKVNKLFYVYVYIQAYRSYILVHTV